MSWNYRLVKKGTRYAIHEAYYDEQGRVHSLSTEPIYPAGDNVKEVEAQLKLLTEALKKEPLDFGSICGYEGDKPSQQ